MKESKLNISWQKLFKKYNIADQIVKNGFFKISANQIKEFREPRLMTKFDWSDSRPELFKNMNLSILPDTRGTYVIGKFNAYKELNYEEVKPIIVRKPDWVKTFDGNYSVTSESVALNLAQMTGMIDIVMNTETVNAVSTITGRLKSGSFNYSIDPFDKTLYPSYKFNVNNAQVEIDAGFESLDKLSVIEAKNRIPKDFMIRQLYYPFVVFNQLKTGKEVLPIYLTHADDIYAFHVFKFKQANNYSSITKVKQINFIIDEALSITLDDVKRISKQSPNKKESPNIPYPQANSITRVLDMLNHLRTPKNKKELAEDYQFDERQGDYYVNALVFLGFAVKSEKGKTFRLTELGKKVANLPNSNYRNEIIIKQILAHESFNLIFDNTLCNYGEYNNDFMTQTIYDKVPQIHTETTARRRASTVKKWIDWIFHIAMSG